MNRPRIRPRSRRAGRAERGQTLVEFALVFPIFFVLLMGLIEFGLVFNALLSINFASRDASLIAAEAGNAVGSDCIVLQKIDDSVGAPATPARISEVRIYKSDKNGNQIGGAVNVYLRTGSTTCTFPDTTSLTVPYSLSGGANYADTTRCNVLAGCPIGTGTVDTIGVRITYHYDWVTPLAPFINLGINDFTMIKANAMRMEPVL